MIPCGSCVPHVSKLRSPETSPWKSRKEGKAHLGEKVPTNPNWAQRSMEVEEYPTERIAPGGEGLVVDE